MFTNSKNTLKELLMIYQKITVEKLETLGKYLMTVMSFGFHDRFIERFQRVECCHAERAREHQRREFRHTVLTSSLSAATGSIARCLRASYAVSAVPSFRTRAPPAGTPRGSPRCTPTSKHGPLAYACSRDSRLKRQWKHSLLAS